MAGRGRAALLRALLQKASEEQQAAEDATQSRSSMSSPYFPPTPVPTPPGLVNTATYYPSQPAQTAGKWSEMPMGPGQAPVFTGYGPPAGAMVVGRGGGGRARGPGGEQGGGGAYPVLAPIPAPFAAASSSSSSQPSPPGLGGPVGGATGLVSNYCTLIRTLPPDHLLLDSAPNLGPLISRWEMYKFENC
jgi:hypothetical protein